MGAARTIFTLGVLGVAAGAYLAFATVPSFAPYRDRRASAPVVLSEPIQGDQQGYASAPPADRRGDGMRIRPDFEQGTLVLELPEWARETGSWFAMGRRALQDWNGWTVPDERAEHGSWDDRRPHGSQPYDQGEPGYAAPRDRDDSGDYRYGAHRYDEEAPGYAPEALRYEAAPAPDFAERGSDVASSAAERAREAARDVRNALKDL